MAARGIDTADKQAFQLFRGRIGSMLRHYRANGLIRSFAGEDGQFMLWEIALSRPPANGRWKGWFAWDEGCGGQACQENRSSRRMPRNGPCCVTCRNRSTAAD